MQTESLPKPPRRWRWIGSAIFFRPKSIWPPCLKLFPTTSRCAAPSPRAGDLRVLRQEPWECLASFILSSTKQIVQIRQIVSLLCERFGEASSAVWRASQLDRRSSFRPKGARVLLNKSEFHSPRRNDSPPRPKPNCATAKWVFARRACSPPRGRLPKANWIWKSSAGLPLAEARAELMKLRGVGGKIADCVLLFAYGFDSAFPVDVWVERALRQLYFPRRRASEKTSAPLCRHAFRAARRLRAAISFPLYADEM